MQQTNDQVQGHIDYQKGVDFNGNASTTWQDGWIAALYETSLRSLAKTSVDEYLKERSK